MRIAQTQQNFQRRKIPRYIYHLTSEANYNSILEDGALKPSYNKFFVDKGVYAIELSNFFKNWKKDRSWGYDDLQYSLLRKVVHWFSSSFNRNKGNLVILRIPTANLDTGKLTIRSQNKLFRHEEDFHKLYPALREHLKGKTPANEAPLYKNRKEAIEYIYSDEISINNIQQIGNIVNIASLRKDIRFSSNPVKFIMQAALSGTPECKELKELD